MYSTPRDKGNPKHELGAVALGEANFNFGDVVESLSDHENTKDGVFILYLKHLKPLSNKCEMRNDCVGLDA